MASEKANGNTNSRKKRGGRQGKRCRPDAQSDHACRRRSESRRAAQDAGTLRKSAEVSYQRLPPESGYGIERRDLQRSLRRNGGGERYRIFQFVRTPPVAVLRQGARGVPAQQESNR